MNIVYMLQNGFHFAIAREFSSSTAEAFLHEKNALEQVGEILTPALRISNCALLRFQEPNVIVLCTVALMGATTLFFYPEKCVEKLLTAFPMTAFIKPWAVELAIYLIAQTHIVGLGLRTYGRLHNAALMQAWQAKSIYAVPIGALKKD